MENVKIDIGSYISFHLKKPREIGNWVFRISGELVCFEYTDYSTAKRKAAKQAESRQISIIHLMA